MEPIKPGDRVRVLGSDGVDGDELELATVCMDEDARLIVLDSGSPDFYELLDELEYREYSDPDETVWVESDITHGREPFERGSLVKLSVEEEQLLLPVSPNLIRGWMEQVEAQVPGLFKFSEIPSSLELLRVTSENLCEITWTWFSDVHVPGESLEDRLRWTLHDELRWTVDQMIGVGYPQGTRAAWMDRMETIMDSVESDMH